MTIARRFIGALLIVTGGVWFLQGMDVIKSSSFMTGQTTWTIIGLAVVVVGIALVAVPRRRRP